MSKKHEQSPNYTYIEPGSLSEDPEPMDAEFLDRTSTTEQRTPGVKTELSDAIEADLISDFVEESVREAGDSNEPGM